MMVFLIHGLGKIEYLYRIIFISYHSPCAPPQISQWVIDRHVTDKIIKLPEDSTGIVILMT